MSRPYIELIAAVGPRWELGYHGGMPWGRIKGDLALFRQVTTGEDKLILCGRKTWQGMPGVAQRRLGARTCVVSRRLDDADVFDALRASAAYRADYVADHRQVWGQYSGLVIIGGGEVYRAALEADLVDVIHLSVIPRAEDEDSPAALWPHDVLFPALNPRGWALTPNGSSPRFAERREPEEGAPHGWSYAQLVRNPLEPALRPDSDGVPRFWGGVGWWC